MNIDITNFLLFPYYLCHIDTVTFYFGENLIGLLIKTTDIKQ